MGLGFSLIFRAVRAFFETNSHNLFFVLFVVFGYLFFFFLSFCQNNACQVGWEGNLAVARATGMVYK